MRHTFSSLQYYSKGAIPHNIRKTLPKNTKLVAVYTPNDNSTQLTIRASRKTIQIDHADRTGRLPGRHRSRLMTAINTITTFFTTNFSKTQQGNQTNLECGYNNSYEKYHGKTLAEAITHNAFLGLLHVSNSYPISHTPSVRKAIQPYLRIISPIHADEPATTVLLPEDITPEQKNAFQIPDNAQAGESAVVTWHAQPSI